MLAVLTRDAARPLDVPARRLTKAAGARRGGRARAGRRRQARLARHLLHRRRRHPRLPRRAARRGARRLVDAATGEVVGTHSGAYAYTVGQRKGLHLERPARRRPPRYVLSITPVTNTVTVGPAEALEVRHVRRRRARSGRPDRARRAVECEVQLRAHGDVVPATVVVEGDRLTAGCAARRAASPPGRPSPSTVPTPTATSCSARPPSAGQPSPRDRQTVPGPGRPAPPPASARCRAPTPSRRSASSWVSCPTCRTCPSCPPAARAPT